jgi:hypothetical protein
MMDGANQGKCWVLNFGWLKSMTIRTGKRACQLQRTKIFVRSSRPFNGANVPMSPEEDQDTRTDSDFCRQSIALQPP